MAAHSVSTSIRELYREAANPMRTNFDNVETHETPFVSAQRDDGSETPRFFDQDEEDEGKSQTSSRSSKSQSSKSSRSSRRSNRRSYVTRTSRFSERASKISHHPMIQEDRNRQKTMFLHELNRMRMSGSNPTREFTQGDDLADIEFECSRIKQNEDQISTVSFMKDAIRLSCTGLELVNNKFKLLRLNGWSSEATRDMERYDRPLSKIYQRYWRKGSVNPFIELCFLLFGSLFVHHFKQVLMGPSPSTTQTNVPTTAPPSRNVSRNVPFNIGSSNAPANPPPTSRRPTMRRPNSNQQAPTSMPQNLMETLLKQQQTASPQPIRSMTPQPNNINSARVAPPRIPQPNVMMGIASQFQNMTGNGGGGVVVVDINTTTRRNNTQNVDLEIVEEETSEEQSYTDAIEENERMEEENIENLPNNDVRIDIGQDNDVRIDINDGESVPTLSFDMDV